jgi:hypothetical protein
MYKDTNYGVVHNLTTGFTIPKDPANADYQLYLVWVECGGVTEKADKINQI